MATIHVCPLHDLAAQAQRLRPSRIVTLLSRETPPPPTPDHIPAQHHLKLEFHDIAEPVAGYTHPTETMVRELLAFVQSWDRSQPIIIHCWAGISRSTAAAFITACAIEPDANEGTIACRLREASATATPNLLMVRHADLLLGRNGRMEAAVRAIGRGLSAPHGQPFELAYRG